MFRVSRGAEDLINFCAINFRRPKKYSNDDIESLISPVGLVLSKDGPGTPCAKGVPSHVRKSLRVFIRRRIVAIRSGRN